MRSIRANMATLAARQSTGTSTSTASKYWVPLCVPPTELRIDTTLRSGQSFRWVSLAVMKDIVDVEDPKRDLVWEDAEYDALKNHFFGIINRTPMVLRQDPNDVYVQFLSLPNGVSKKIALGQVKAYFNLTVSVGKVSQEFVSQDDSGLFETLLPVFPGVRVLRQDPTECLMSFLCSQNNNVQRISQLVERMCHNYGVSLGSDFVIRDVCGRDVAMTKSMFAFPTLNDLRDVTEQTLRADGYGYRAKYIVGTVAKLLEYESTMKSSTKCSTTLEHLRGTDLNETLRVLCELPGVGRKVASCIALFCLDKFDSVPIDTHMWAIALQYFNPEYRNQNPTEKKLLDVTEKLRVRFGEYAGWAQQVLFVSRLPEFRDRFDYDAVYDRRYVAAVPSKRAAPAATKAGTATAAKSKPKPSPKRAKKKS